MLTPFSSDPSNAAPPSSYKLTCVMCTQVHICRRLEGVLGQMTVKTPKKHTLIAATHSWWLWEKHYSAIEVVYAHPV